MNPHDLLASLDENSMAFRTPLQRSFADAISMRSTSSLPSADNFDKDDDEDYDIHSAISADRIHYVAPVYSNEGENNITHSNQISDEVMQNANNTSKEVNTCDFDKNNHNMFSNAEVVNNINNTNNNEHNRNNNNNLLDNHNYIHKPDLKNAISTHKQSSKNVLNDNKVYNNIDITNNSNNNSNDDIDNNNNKKIHQEETSQEIEKYSESMYQEPEKWSVAKIQMDPATALSALQRERAQRIIAEQQIRLLLPANASSLFSPLTLPTNEHSNRRDTENTTMITSTISAAPDDKYGSTGYVDTRNNAINNTTNSQKGTNKTGVMTLDAATLQALSKQIVECHDEIDSIVMELIRNYKADFKTRPLVSASSSSSACSNSSTPFTSALTSNTLLRWLLDELINKLPNLPTSKNNDEDNDAISVEESNVSHSSGSKIDHVPVLMTSRNKFKGKGVKEEVLYSSSSIVSNENKRPLVRQQEEEQSESHSNCTDTVIHQSDYVERQRRWFCCF